MKLIPSASDFLEKLQTTFLRFPIVITWSIIFTIFSIYAIEIDRNEEQFAKIIIVASLGISWLIATRFLIEELPKIFNLLFFLVIGLLLLFYSSIPKNDFFDMTSGIRLALYILSGHLFIIIAPFILKYNKVAFFNHFNTIFFAIGRSVFFSIVIFLGISLALTAVKYLFNFHFSDQIFFKLFAICIGIINTWIFLSTFPKDIPNQTENYFDKPAEVFAKYILIPLAIIYIVILYTYGFKILIKWNLPKGWVSYLVIILTLLGFLIQLLINPFEKNNATKFINKFQPWFYRLLIPLLGLLFVAIFRRISDYGITESRYFLIAIALWILGITLYMLFSKHKKVIVFLASLAIISVFSSFGFWGTFSVSVRSQVQQFTKIYNEVKSTNFKTSHSKKERFEDIVFYLAQREKTDLLSDVLGFNPEEKFKDLGSWRMQSAIVDDILQIKTDKHKPTKIHVANKRKNYYLISDAISVKGYDLLKNNVTITSYPKKQGNFKIWIEKNEIIIEKNSKEIGEIPYTNFTTELLKNNNDNIINPDKITLTKNFKSANIKIIFKNITILVSTKEITYGEIYLLIKEK